MSYYLEFTTPPPFRTHHLARWCQPLPTLDHAEGTIAQLLEQRQVLVADQAGEGLLLALAGTRRGGRLAEGAGRLGLELTVRPLSAEHLEEAKGKRVGGVVNKLAFCNFPNHL